MSAAAAEGLPGSGDPPRLQLMLGKAVSAAAALAAAASVAARLLLARAPAGLAPEALPGISPAFAAASACMATASMLQRASPQQNCIMCMTGSGLHASISLFKCIQIGARNTRTIQTSAQRKAHHQRCIAATNAVVCLCRQHQRDHQLC
jgi:hypothetical protein